MNAKESSVIAREGGKMRRRIRVLTVIRQPVGGIRTYLKYTYKHLDRNKYQFTILAVKGPEEQLIRADLEEFDLDVKEIEGKHLELLMIYNIFRELRKNKFHVIHSQGLTAGVLSNLGNLISRVPHIITPHGVFRSEEFSPPFGKIKRAILGRVLGMADIIQSVGYDAEENLVQFLPFLAKKRRKLVVIRNGIMVESLVKNTEINKRNYRKEIGIDDDVFLFGFLGRFMPQKGFVYLIDAVEELSKDRQFGNRFKIIAVNDGAFIREYKSIIMEKRLSDYFSFHEFIPNVNEILTELDALVMPSLWEAYSLLPCEAFILGCPVIASNCIGLREVIKDTPALVIREKDSHSIAEAMIKFMENPGAIKKKAIEFMGEARERFDSIHTSRQLDSLFSRIAQ